MAGIRRDDPNPRPFVKWAGGKRQLLPVLTESAPKDFDTYHEPFVGGGALFFALVAAGRVQKAVLSDNNLRLVRTWRAVRDSVDEVMARLAEMPNTLEFFTATKKVDIDAATEDAAVAAWFIYLNKTGFNGLYRVNSRGIYNVPYAYRETANVCDRPTLRQASQALQGVEILHAGFDAVAERAVAGDFVYFDPPYVPLSTTASFTAYTRDGFTLADQARLRDVAAQLKARGVHVLLSNSSADAVRELYAEGFTQREVAASRMINSKGDRRGAIAELVIW